MIFGYARVSTKDQNLTAQLDALEAAGAERVFKEKKTGSNSDRRELTRLLEQLRQGDVLVVTVNAHPIVTPYRRPILTRFVLSWPGAA